MNSILEIDTDNFVAVVEAGVVTQTLHEAVEAKGLYYPPDPASRGSCMIGGNIAENAGGPHAAKYGVTGRWVMGLEAVFADGGVAVTGGKTRKDVAGYDLTSLLLGSEGTLGVVTKAWLRLIPKPPHWATLVAPFPTLEDAARCVLELHRRGLVLSACEFVDKPSIDLSSKRKGVGVPFPEAEARLLLEFDGPSEAEVERDVTLAGEIALECAALDVVLATDEAKRRVLWERAPRNRRGGPRDGRLGRARPRRPAHRARSARRGDSPNLGRGGSEVRRVRARGGRQPPRPPLARRKGPGRTIALREDGDRDLRRDCAPRRHRHGGARRRHHVEGRPFSLPPARVPRRDARDQAAPSTRTAS